MQAPVLLVIFRSILMPTLTLKVNRLTLIGLFKFSARALSSDGQLIISEYPDLYQVGELILMRY
jgi:hypothetical protein